MHTMHVETQKKHYINIFMHAWSLSDSRPQWASV